MVVSDSRDAAVDVLRGVAILTMLGANLAGPVLREPHPFWLRLYGSFAAPLFVLLSGMMVGRTAAARGRRPTYFLARGLVLVAVAALVDVGIWQIVPFTSVDVLYLIGVCLPLCALVLPAGPPTRWTIVVLVLLATPVLQSILGYTPYPTEFSVSGAAPVGVDEQTPTLNHWLVDGFFPIFPWAGFALLGACLSGRRWRGRAPILVGSVVLFVAGAVIWRRWPGPLLTRGGYSELFYPPTLGYVITAVGLIGILFWLVDRGVSLPGHDALRALGESSLAMYVLHLAAIHYLVKPLRPSRIELPAFVVVYLALAVLLVVAAYGLRRLKRRWRPRALPLRLVLGG